MSFGIDPLKVYANDGDGNLAFWTVFHGHVHGEIVKALKLDQAIQVAIQAKINKPNDDKKRGFAIDLINRATVNCIGQHIVGQSLHPAKASFSIYNILDHNTATAIDGVIGASANTKLHDAFVAKSADAILDVISRQTGRALFQTCLHQSVGLLADPSKLLSKLEEELRSLAKGIVPGIP